MPGIHHYFFPGIESVSIPVDGDGFGRRKKRSYPWARRHVYLQAFRSGLSGSGMLGATGDVTGSMSW